MRRFACSGILIPLVFAAHNCPGATATLTTLHAFNGTNGNAPVAELVLGTNGVFYGTTEYGGTNNNCSGGCGTIFQITPGGAFASLHSFTNYDGSHPRGGLVQHSDGNFYGTTSFGGTFGPGGIGTVFRMTPGGVFNMIHSFDTGGGGIGPECTLVEGSDGELYGTTPTGGTVGVGNAFRVTTNGFLTVLNGINEASAGLILGSDGNFYGTTQFGGSGTNCTYGCGTVFRITPAGVVTTLHSFNGTDGKEPLCTLVQGSDGNLYGTTSGGPTAALNCSGGCGTVFMISTNGVFTNLHAFSGTDGRQPLAGLMQGSDGFFYGTSSHGGGNNFGSIFQIDTNGNFTRLISFNAVNGGNPAAPLVEGTDGNYYGTTMVGGTNSVGTVFKLTVTTNSVVTNRLVLTPKQATNSVGTLATTVATVTTNGFPRPDTTVNFNIAAGPNRNVGFSGKTDASGQVSFIYTGSTKTGTDTVFAVSLSVLAFSTNIWVAPDSVGDGIPDWWRAQYFGGTGSTTNSLSCGTCDADGTGQNNLFKYIAGLDPTNAASVFTFRVQTLSNQSAQRSLIFSPVVAGRSYSPQFNTGIGGGAWLALPSFTGPTTNQNQGTITDLSATQALKFYRLGISLP